MQADTLICATAGSVDDGKSTLIGRLLLDSRALMRDQLTQLEQASARRGFSRTELALVTDGLRAEREQGITIDAAWRYFSTPRRRFVLADTPGHVQYTRNMITGASQADVAIVLIDAERGLTEQTRRHLAITALLRTPLVFGVINKMDRVDFSQARFDELAAEANLHLAQLPWSTAIRYLPTCALDGDNVVTRSARIPWYQGAPLLEELETAAPTQAAVETGVLPVQWIIRPQREDYADFRGIAGRVASGTLRVGDDVVVAPNLARSKIARIYRSVAGDREPQTHASRGDSVVITLEHDVDAARGAYVVGGRDLPQALPTRQRLRVEVCWMNERPLQRGQRLWVKHQARRVAAQVTAVRERLDVTTGNSAPTDKLQINDLGTVELVLADPIVASTYVADRALGSALLVDPQRGDTLGAAMIVDNPTSPDATASGDAHDLSP